MKKQFITRVFLSSLVLALTSLFGGGNLLAQTVDKLTAGLFPAKGTQYADFSGVTATSSAVYAGNSANNSGAIQLRSDKSISGIVTTASGGKVSKIVLDWKSNTATGRTIDVYGKSSAYKSAADLYSSSSDTQGTLIGSITCGTSTTLDVKVKGDYEYIGLRSRSGALYLNSVKITWASSGGSGGSEETTKKDPNLAYDPSNCTVIVGETPELPTLSKPEGVEGIVYESSNTAVATVNAKTGEVTLTGAVGTTTITASLKGDATYADGSASYTLTVKKPFVYKKVSSAEDLVDGGVYIMVCDELKSTISAIESNKGTPTDVTISGDIVEAITGNVVEFTLEDKDTYYRFKNDELYLYGKSSTTIGLKEFGTDNDQKWKITIDAEVTKISCLEDGIKNRQIGVNTTNANKFGLYSEYNTKTFPGINLYRKVYPLTVSSATSGYATFYNEEEAYQMPAGLTGYAVTKAEKDNYITRKTAYKAGATVPAKTPLLIIGTTDGGNYYPAVVSGDGVTTTYEGSNLLEGARDANGKTQSANKNVYYYKLGLNSEGQLGFYWGAAGGAAFQMKKATTAYLAIPQSIANGANALFFDFGPETGINEIQTEQADKAIFDLSGRRVQKATKGFYIVGGKKVLVK